MNEDNIKGCFVFQTTSFTSELTKYPTTPSNGLMPSCYCSPCYAHNCSYCALLHSAPLPLFPLQRSSTPSTSSLSSSPHPHTNKMCTQEIQVRRTRIKLNALTTKYVQSGLGAFSAVSKKLTDATETIPYLAIRATDLPSPSFLFSHFTGRYWFPVLFFLLHVLVGPHLFLIQQAGSLEFTFLPDKLPSQTKKKRRRKKLIISYF